MQTFKMFLATLVTFVGSSMAMNISGPGLELYRYEMDNAEQCYILKRIRDVIEKTENKVGMLVERNSPLSKIQAIKLLRNLEKNDGVEEGSYINKYNTMKFELKSKL